MSKTGWFKAFCLLTALGLLLHIIGLAVPSWSEKDFDSSIARGLWEQCIPDCKSYDSASVRPVQGLVILAMAFGFLGLALFCWTILCGCDKRESCDCCKSHDSRGEKRLWIAMAATVTNMAFTIIGAIIWAVSIHDNLIDYKLGAGFGLCLAGGIAIGFGGLGAFGMGLKIIPNRSQVHDLCPSPTPTSRSVLSSHPAPTAPTALYPSSEFPPPYSYH